MRSRVSAAAVAAAAAAAIGGCGSDGSDRPVPQIEHNVVEVSMREYGFDYKQPVPDGRVVFRVVNNGRQIHRLTMLELPQDLPPIDQQLRGRKRRNVTPFAGIGGLEPGARNSFAVDLVRGRRYGMIDPTGAVNGQSNAALGLNSEFRAGGGRPGPRAGAAEGTARKAARRPRAERETSRRTRRSARPRKRAAARDAGLSRETPGNAGVGPVVPP